MIKAILFDGDGVMLEPNRFAQALTERGITQDKVLPFFNGVFQECLLGKLDTKEELAKHLPDWGWDGTLEELFTLWHTVEDATRPEMAELVTTLRGLDYVCCLATNQDRYRTEYMLRQMGYGELFDHVYSSCNLHRKKEDPQYFRLISDELGIPCSEMLLLDDSPSHIAGAQQAGVDAELVDSYDKAHQAIQSRGLLMAMF